MDTTYITNAINQILAHDDREAQYLKARDESTSPENFEYYEAKAEQERHKAMRLLSKDRGDIESVIFALQNIMANLD